MPQFSSDRVYFNVTEAENLGLGQSGAEFINDTTLHTGAWVCLQCIEDSNFSVLQGNNFTGTWTGYIFPAGTHIFGRFTQIQLSAGAVIAYKL
ncbi:MAG: hypothetical protein KatS3mg031_2986 [Chitinophagales bacterium]|nr:MAG: hypothetical protein KatS3mg031_2915 [Chitinophagales bacterium]GIV35451.1 MAG: hypothetical protein KatS3mg031_2986 [Chitinophagales bacterium]